MFRTLKTDEIECRVQTLKENGCSLLLYKDARADMVMLDEVVGPMNWMRSHVRDNANCIVSIWDEAKKQWISKEDTGTESYTEKEKGLASDSFKRACFNWGIGRELYTGPFIWINLNKEDTNNTNGKIYLKSGLKFNVKSIEYDEKRHIVGLVIEDNKGKVRYTYGKQSPAAPSEPESQVVMIKENHLKALFMAANDNRSLVAAAIKTHGFDSFAFPIENYKEVMKTVEKMMKAKAKKEEVEDVK